MLNSVDFIKNIETGYDVETITVSGIQVWPFLRNEYFSSYNNKYVIKEAKKRIAVHELAKRFGKVFHGFWNLVNRYDYIVLSEVLDLRMMGGKLTNRVVGGLVSVVGKGNILLLENPISDYHHGRGFRESKDVLSSGYLFLIAQVFGFTRNSRIQGEDILERINSEFKLGVDYRKIIGQFLCYRRLFNILFKLKKPKALFLTNYYNVYNQAAIFSAKQLGIPILEFQHGLINKADSNYYVFTELDSSFFPDYLLSFGGAVKGVFNGPNHLMDANHVIPVGSFYIEHMLKNDGLDDSQIDRLKDFNENYSKVVVVSSQWTIEEKLIDFVNRTAAMDPSILYIFMPRNINTESYGAVEFENNIIMIDDMDIYQISKYVDFHLTVYSSFALEAPALGTRNILIDLEGMAQMHLGDILTDERTTRFVNNETDCVKLINDWHSVGRGNIMQFHKDFFEQDHVERLNTVITELILPLDKKNDKTRHD